MAHAGGSKIVVQRLDEEDDLYGGSTAIYVCHGNKGKTHKVLEFDQVWPRFANWTIAGRTAAFSLSTWDSSCDKYGEPPWGCQTQHSVHAVDTKTGRTLVTQTSYSKPLHIVASPQGGLAWLVASGPNRNLWFARKGVGPVLMASTPNIPIASVALTPTTLRWTGGDVPQVAMLP